MSKEESLPHKKWSRIQRRKRFRSSGKTLTWKARKHGLVGVGNLEMLVQPTLEVLENICDRDCRAEVGRKEG